MKLFKTRRDSKYYAELIKDLNIDALCRTAIPLQSSQFDSKGKEYNSFIRIDFVGLSCTVLFDKPGRYIGRASMREKAYVE